MDPKLRETLDKRLDRLIDILYFHLQLGMNHRSIRHLETTKKQLGWIPLTPEVVSRIGNTLQKVKFDNQSLALKKLDNTQFEEFIDLCKNLK